MPPSKHLLAAVREFTSTILNPFDLQELLFRLTGHAAAVTDASGAGIMLAGEQGLGFAAASSNDIVEVEVVQSRVQSGPCRDAYASGDVIAVDDLRSEERWPEYRVRARELGFGAVIGLPMRAWGQLIGVLDIYRRDPGPWTAEDIDGCEIMASMGAGYILHANQLRAQHDLAQQLQVALESRDTIGQAKGILMSRHGVTADEAFEMLRTASQDTNVKLRDVAAQFVDRARDVNA